MMNLKEFVSGVLTQIIEGVQEAQAGRTPESGQVNPGLSTTQGILQARGHMVSRRGELVQDVEFDVALTTNEGTQTKGGIGVFVGAVGLGSQGQSDQSHSSVSRVKFSVPLTLPVTND
jgi:hypothetical protein